MLPIPYTTQILMSTLKQTSIYMAHERIVESFVNKDIDEVERAFTYHTEIIIKHLNEELLSEIERKEMVRNIKRKSPLKLLNRKKSNSQDKKQASKRTATFHDSG